MMKRAAYILMLMTVILSCKKEGLTMSYSSADISGKPEEHMVLAGFAARDGLSDGIHLPLFTHCMVVGDGSQKVCIISRHHAHHDFRAFRPSKGEHPHALHPYSFCPTQRRSLQFHRRNKPRMEGQDGGNRGEQCR